MIELRPLAGVSWETLAQVFNAAFSDYAVPMAMSAEGLAAMQVRRGYAAEHSYGAFLGDELVGFALTGIGGLGGLGGLDGLDGEVAYNGGTGVVPAHRRGQLGKRLVEAVAAQVPARRYVLEVIEDNGAAVALYRRLGFVEQRRLQCWTLAAPGAAGPGDGASSRGARADGLAEQSLAELEAALAERDIQPSWQNTLAALRRAVEPPLVLGDEHGAVAVFPSSGDVPLLCVRRSSRRQGHGRRLLAAAQARAGRGLRLINVDARDEGISAFLSAAGATRTVVQLEMEWGLR
jgi:ribosomal protein S18 acetylase RimI-like enzyme